MVGKILIESLFDKRTVVSVVEGDVFQFGGEGGVAAVVAPIGVEHTNLGHCGVAVLLAGEIVLNVEEVVESHCQAKAVVKLAQGVLVHILETIEDSHVGRVVENGDKGFGFLLVGKAAVHRVDAVFHYGVFLGLG